MYIYRTLVRLRISSLTCAGYIRSVFELVEAPGIFSYGSSTLATIVTYSICPSYVSYVAANGDYICSRQCGWTRLHGVARGAWDTKGSETIDNRFNCVIGTNVQ